MKIYYAHSIKWAHTLWEWTPHDIIPLLKKEWYHVLSEEIYTQQKDISDEEIYQRDTTMIQVSDCILANITNPSLWVWYELAYAESLHKPVICFSQGNSFKKVSSMITGNKYFHTYIVNDISEITKLLKVLQ